MHLPLSPAQVSFAIRNDLAASGRAPPDQSCATDGSPMERSIVTAGPKYAAIPRVVLEHLSNALHLGSGIFADNAALVFGHQEKRFDCRRANSSSTNRFGSWKNSKSS